MIRVTRVTFVLVHCAKNDLEVSDTPRTEPSAKMNNSGKNIANYLSQIDDRCCNHPNKVLEIYSPEGQSSSTIDRTYLKPDRVFCSFKFGDCLRATVANGLHDIGEKEKAMEFLVSFDRHVKLLAHAPTFVEDMGCMVGMRRV